VGFGSTAWGRAHAGSDLDLLIEGLTIEDWSRACAAVERIAGTVVDLVRIEEAPVGLVTRVREHGILLHGSR
jgi:predicted nucleotidyltransferase